jgi:DNA-binding NarL/FixJ family response regulator
MSVACLSALVADDHELFRSAFVAILKREFACEKVMETASLEEAVELLGRSPNVALVSLDLAMPGMKGAASAHAIANAFPGSRLVVVTASERRQDILDALAAGVHGYIPKTLRISEIVEAIRTVLSGRIYAPISLATLARTPASSVIGANAAGRRLGDLSPRQREVLRLMAEGKSNKEIAKALYLAEGTVKVHVNALFRALSVNNRASAVARMGDFGLTRP